VKLCVALVCLAACWSTGVYADKCGAALKVSAQVVPTARLSMIDSPASMLVTSRDVQRGAKTLHVRLRVTGNSPTGYLLHVVPHVGLTTQMRVQGLPNELLIAEDCADVLLTPGAAGDELLLTIKLQLKPDVPAGRYPMPLSFSVSPFMQA
jgi:hypothetical protein